jgi:SHS2 domain-containing protein
MTYRFLPDVALADIAFEAESESVDGLFETCALAITDIMVDPKTLQTTTERNLSIQSENLDRLLYDFMTELIVLKDVDSLLFGKFQVRVSNEGTSLQAVVEGEPIDRQRHILRNDVKAVTMHLFGVKHEGKTWRTTVVLDI